MSHPPYHCLVHQCSVTECGCATPSPANGRSAAAGYAARLLLWLIRERGNDDRRVKVFKYEKTTEPGKRHMEKVEDGEADFHEWGVEYEEFETGPGPFSTAIIERDDGTVETPVAHMIQFLRPNGAGLLRGPESEPKEI